LEFVRNEICLFVTHTHTHTRTHTHIWRKWNRRIIRQPHAFEYES